MKTNFLPVRNGWLVGLALLLSMLLSCSDASGRAADGSPLAGKVVAGKTLGLFFMTRYWVGQSLEKAAYYFVPTGQVYQNPTGFTATALAAVPAGRRGSYAVAGGKMTIKWADGHTSASPVEAGSPDGFGWDAGVFLGVKPFASARQLAGAFEGGNFISSDAGGLSVSSDLTFRPDGTYAQAGAATGHATSAGSTTQVGSAGSGGGQWQLRDWVLTLTAATGKTTSGVAFPVETDEKTGQVTRFYFNNVAYKRL